ncbi:MAG: ATP synthase subunit I [Desulfobacteraceae bacterium]|nr:MAG: ATP synthase subunit I [Desulfobacteraceae bacterium]
MQYPVNIQERLLRFVLRSNWILFGAASLFGFYLASSHVTKGIVCGGLIVSLNFHLMYRTLKKALTPPHLSSHAALMAKSYVRFLISGAVIFMLISRGYVHPLGLFIGLSIVVASILAGTLYELKRMICEEAV